MKKDASGSLGGRPVAFCAGVKKKEGMKNETEIILNSIADGVFTVDRDWKITTFNRAAERITGIRKEDAIGRHCWEVFRASICENLCSLRHTMETGNQVVNQSMFIVNSQGDRIPVSISTAILKGEDEEIIGGVETFRDLSLVETLRKELWSRHSFSDIISKNKEIHHLFQILEQVSETDSTILLEGESGTGKELFAKAVHSLSRRKSGPMVTFNCGSLPDTLLESELFGYKAGAFTDAKKDKPGRLALAEGGTLFLDEIGDVSPALQVRLLRVLQDRIYEPLGSTQSQKADVRIVCATNKNLDQLVREGSFRHDLYYRINVVRLFLPPLRERKEDIPLLISHFIRKFNHIMGKEIQGISPEVLPILMAHAFRGNIRELENIVEYAMVVCKEGRIGMEHLPESLLRQAEGGTKAAQRPGGQKDFSWGEIESQFIYEVLRKNAWNRTAAAAQMGVHPSTLWRKIRRYNLVIPSQDGRSRKDPPRG